MRADMQNCQKTVLITETLFYGPWTDMLVEDNSDPGISDLRKLIGLVYFAQSFEKI